MPEFGWLAVAGVKYSTPTGSMVEGFPKVSPEALLLAATKLHTALNVNSNGDATLENPRALPDGTRNSPSDGKFGATIWREKVGCGPPGLQIANDGVA